MNQSYIAELRRQILMWQFAESLLDADDPSREFYKAATNTANENIRSASVKELPHHETIA